jgi:hypothetical protein
MGWTFVMLIWLIVIGLAFYWFVPTVHVVG